MKQARAGRNGLVCSKANKTSGIRGLTLCLFLGTVPFSRPSTCAGHGAVMLRIRHEQDRSGLEMAIPLHSCPSSTRARLSVHLNEIPFQAA